MIVRIVKMVFREEEVESFKQLFTERKSLIRNFEGCTHLELLQDKTNPNIFLLTAGGIPKNIYMLIALLTSLMTPGV